jgi:hypothetical protein
VDVLRQGCCAVGAERSGQVRYVIRLQRKYMETLKDSATATAAFLEQSAKSGMQYRIAYGNVMVGWLSARRCLMLDA